MSYPYDEWPSLTNEQLSDEIVSLKNKGNISPIISIKKEN